MLGAILEVLGQNETDDLEIETDSLTSLRAICTHSDRYEDLNFKTQTRLKAFSIRLGTRLARTAFKWVKGHE